MPDRMVRIGGPGAQPVSAADNNDGSFSLKVGVAGNPAGVVHLGGSELEPGIRVYDLGDGSYGLAVADGSQPFAIIPRNWNDVWRAARVGSGAAPTIITIWGDSFEVGVATSDWINKGWPRLLKAQLVADGHPAHGDFWPATFSVAFSPAYYAGTPIWTYATVPSSWAFYGITRTPSWSTLPADPASFTSPYACTDMDIVYLDGFAGSWTWRLDGVAQAQVNTVGDGTLKRIQIRGLANTAHTIVFAGQSASLRMLIQGVTTYQNLAAGIGIGNISFSGNFTLEFLRQSSGVTVPLDRIALFKNALGAMPLGCSLFIDALGVNDCANFVGIQQFREAKRRVYEAVRKAVPNCSILVVAKSYPDPSYTDSTTSFSTPENHDPYLQVNRQMAADYNGAFVNFHAKWGSDSVATGKRLATEGHPGDAGHQDMADTLHRILAA